MSIHTRLQILNSVSLSKWPELSLGVSPSPIGGSWWFTSCVQATDSTLVASVLTFPCQKFERALTGNVLTCDFCAFSPKPSALLIISCCHNHREGLLKSPFSQHSLATHSLLPICKCYRQKATHLGQILSQEMERKAWSHGALPHDPRKNPRPFTQPANSLSPSDHWSSPTGRNDIQYKLQGTLERKVMKKKFFGLTIFPDTLREVIM